MTIRIEQSTGQRITEAELMRRGYSVTEGADISAWGFPALTLTDPPQPEEGKQVVEGPDEKVKARNPDGTWIADDPDTPQNEAWVWQQTWVQEPIPPEPVPQTISRAQGKAVLIQQGLWAAVLAFVSGIEDDTERALAEVALNDTQEWRRDSPFLTTAAAALGLTEEQMDAMFTAAAQVGF